LVVEPLRGALFENFIINEYQKSIFNQGKNIDLYFWRNNIGNEIDLIVEDGNNVSYIEIKSSQTFNHSFLKGINYLESISKNIKIKKVVIYGGDIKQLRSDVSVLPWTEIK